jgi:hypothetical protein
MQATSKQNHPTNPKPNINSLSTKIGQCQICKQTKQVLILKYGFNLCADCLNVCTGILEHLQNEAEKTPTIKPKKAHPKTSKNPVRKAATKNVQASTKN